MTKNEEFEQVLDLFTHPGWKYVVEDIDSIRKSYASIKGIDNLLDLGRHQGRVEQLEFFLNLRAWYERGQALIEEQDDAETL